MEVTRFFEEPGIGASVLLANGEEYLPVDEKGFLAIPENVEPQGFHLVLLLPKGENRTFITQKNVGKEKGAYHNQTMEAIEVSETLISYLMIEPIEVKRAGKNVWTFWHSQERPNRADCFRLEKDGSLYLYQIGVLTHDNGATWLLHGEYRWRGRLFNSDKGLVAKPESPKWGSFAGRDVIFNHPDFQNLASETTFDPWQGAKEDLEPPLGDIPGPGFARIQWYVPFGGQTGQGIAIVHQKDHWKEEQEGRSMWVHGIDIAEPPDPDGVKRLWSNDLVSFSGTQHFGKQRGRPPKLLNVKKVG